MQQVHHEIISRAAHAMIATPDDQLAKGVLGYVDAQGRECFCTMGFICNEAVKAGLISVRWADTPTRLVGETAQAKLAAVGATKVAIYDEIWTGMAPDSLAASLGLFNPRFGDDRQKVVTVINDESDSTPRKLGERILQHGIWGDTLPDWKQ